MTLDISRCYDLMDASLVLVAEYCPELTTLSAFGCTNLTDASWLRAAQISRA